MTSATRRALYLVLAGLALAVVVGAFLLSRTPLAGPENVSAPAPRAASGSTAAFDSARVATSAFEACGRKAGADETSCYEERLVGVVRDAGIGAAMGALRELGRLDRDVAAHGHVYAHAIGIAGYDSGGELAETFASCSEIYQSGCYHGVIQAYFQEVEDPAAESVNRLCSAYGGPAGDRWLLFQCVHGMGHGLMLYYAHDLPRALAGCDLLRDDWDRESCYGGAFMENIVNAVAPHHPGGELMARDTATRGEGGQAEAARSIESHAHGGAAPHGHAGAAPHGRGGPTVAGKAGSGEEAAGDDHGSGDAAGGSFKALDSADLHYPCSIMDQRYLDACYQMQTSVILHFNGGDFEAAAGTCDRAPRGLRSVCYQSLGRDASAYTLQDHAEGIRLCSLGSPRFQPWCFVGLVKNFVDLTARTDEGFAFCRKVPAKASKLKCYQALGEQIAVLENGAAERAAACEQAPRHYVDACRYGARLRDVPPPDLPVGG